MATVVEAYVLVRYYREWSDWRTLKGAWFRRGNSCESAHTSDVPFGIGGGYDTAEEARAEEAPEHWQRSRVVRVTLTHVMEEIEGTVG